MPHPPRDANRAGWNARLGLVVVSGAGEPGLQTALRLCDDLPVLRCPTLFSLRDADPSPLAARIDGNEICPVESGQPISAARIWIAPSDRNTVVRDGSFELGEPGAASIGQLPSLGMLYHSVRVEFGSRVFVVVTDHGREDTPVLRLLTQRGAEVVSPNDGPNRWTIPDIVGHLDARAGASQEAAVA